MACQTCGGRPYMPVTNVVKKEARPEDGTVGASAVVGASDDPSKKVRLRYYGGGLVRQTSGSGCVSCGGSKGYTTRTSENIMFVSDDAPGGMFNLTVHLGHDYYVTEKQAEHLLSDKYTFYDRGGQKLHKFKRIED